MLLNVPQSFVKINFTYTSRLDKQYNLAQVRSIHCHGIYAWNMSFQAYMAGQINKARVIIKQVAYGSEVFCAEV